VSEYATGRMKSKYLDRVCVTVDEIAMLRQLRFCGRFVAYSIGTG
jgi:hypothetical protein